MSGTTEAFARVKIDALLKDAGWNLTDGSSVLFEHALPDGTLADYVLCDRQGRPMAALEAKRASTDPITAQDQGRHYAEQIGVPYRLPVERRGSAVPGSGDRCPRAPRSLGFYAQDDLERRIAVRRIRRESIDGRYRSKISLTATTRSNASRALSAEVSNGRRKLLVEMATGTGKTRTAAAFIKRLFEAGIVTRVLFLVDRIALARQAEDAFTDHLRGLSLSSSAARPRFRSRQAHHDSDAANHDRGIPRSLAWLLRPRHYGRMSSLDLRQVERCAAALRRHPTRPDGHALHRGYADQLPDPEDGLFVRDTLRFFELSEPTFQYLLRRAIKEGHLVPYRIYKAITVKTAAEDGFTVRRDELDWTAMDKQTRERSSRNCSPTRIRSRWIRGRWNASSPFPNATAPWCASSATHTRRASWAGTACGAGPPWERPSCSR